MGLLKVGRPLGWTESINHCNYIRRHGVKQFIATYRRVKDIDNDVLFYGDEVEYALLRVDRDQKMVQISLRGIEAMEELRKKEQNIENVRGCSWHQEYGSWMVEGTPSAPYSGYTVSLVQVEQNMRLRRARLLSALRDDEIAPTMVVFPLMGVGSFVHPASPIGGPASLSDSVPDACINSHPRFPTLTANIRNRRGSKVDIRVPLFHDTNTPEFKEGGCPPDAVTSNGVPAIMMDCMAFGMGCCCLQVTFQASSMDESRYLYDQLAPLAPLMLALTAAAPVFKGRLADTDVRWGVISASVDDRTPAELGKANISEQKPDDRLAGGGVRLQSKSRYDSISCYIHPESDQPGSSGPYNDVVCELDAECEEMLLEEGIDGALARHVAHLFTRDPLVAFEGMVDELDDEKATDHFESIQSTNWQTVRWKPPPPKANICAPHIGWRTEFRSMEVQLTDFENAAFTAFIVLVTRALLVFDLCLLVPLSKVDDNMKRAHAKDSTSTQKFWFRKHILPEGHTVDENNALFEEMTIDEVINGKGSYFPGLVPLCLAYLEHIRCDPTSYPRIQQYLTFISLRAEGKLLTPAAWIRKFVQTHPDYRGDSVVTPSIAYDLTVACDQIGQGRLACPELHGDVKIEPIPKDGVYETPLVSSRMRYKERADLLKAYTQRACQEDGPGSKPCCSRARSFSRQRSNSMAEQSGLMSPKRGARADPTGVDAFKEGGENGDATRL